MYSSRSLLSFSKSQDTSRKTTWRTIKKRRRKSIFLSVENPSRMFARWVWMRAKNTVNTLNAVFNTYYCHFVYILVSFIARTSVVFQEWGLFYTVLSLIAITAFFSVALTSLSVAFSTLLLKYTCATFMQSISLAVISLLVA